MRRYISRVRHRSSDRLDARLLHPFTSHEGDKHLLTDDCRLQFVDECWPNALRSSWLMVRRPSVPFALPPRSYGSIGCAARCVPPSFHRPSWPRASAIEVTGTQGDSTKAQLSGHVLAASGGDRSAWHAIRSRHPFVAIAVLSSVTLIGCIHTQDAKEREIDIGKSATLSRSSKHLSLSSKVLPQAGVRSQRESSDKQPPQCCREPTTTDYSSSAGM